MLLEPYRRLWSKSRESEPSLAVTFLLLVVCTGFPIAIGLLPFNPMIPLVALALVAAVIGIALFFNVNSFAVYIVPLIFLSGESHLALVIVVLLFVSYLAWRVRVCDISFRLPYPFVIALIILSGINGIFRALDFAASRFFLIYTVIVPLFAFLVYYNLQPSTKNIRAHLTLICIIAAIIGWISFGTYLYTGIPRTVATWAFGSQNRGAAFLGIMFPFALVSFIDSIHRRKNVILWTWIFLGIIAGILHSQTRAVIISVIIAAFYISLHDKLAMRIMIPVLIIALITLPSLLITRMAMLLGMGEVDWSSIGRVQIWTNSLEMLPKYFWFGMGIDNFSIIYPIKYPFSFLKAIHAHNIYLKMIFDYGVFGLIGFLMLVLGCQIRGQRAVRNTASHRDGNDEVKMLLALNAGIICLLIAGLMDSLLLDHRVAVIFWIFLAYQLVLSKRISGKGKR